MIRVPSLEPSLAMEVGPEKNICGFISCVEKKMFTIKMSQLLCRCIIVLVVITGLLIGCEKKNQKLCGIFRADCVINYAFFQG